MILADPQTGELHEILDSEYVQNSQPYSYQEAKAAAMRASVERRRATADYEQSVISQAAAEREYRKILATEILVQKSQHGATNAEALAKGQDTVARAREALTIAEGRTRALLEILRTCDGDRTAQAQLTRWSQSIEGWSH